jgi:hypothetical protein
LIANRFSAVKCDSIAFSQLAQVGVYTGSMLYAAMKAFRAAVRGHVPRLETDGVFIPPCAWKWSSSRFKEICGEVGDGGG